MTKPKLSQARGIARRLLNRRIERIEAIRPAAEGDDSYSFRLWTGGRAMLLRVKRRPGSPLGLYFHRRVREAGMSAPELYAFDPAAGPSGQACAIWQWAEPLPTRPGEPPASRAPIPISRGADAAPDDLARRRAVACRCAAQKMAAEPDLIGAMLFGSSARGDVGPESDVDVLLFNAAGAGDDWLIRHWHERHDGYEVEFNEISAAAGLDVERTLADAYWVSGVYDGSILLDPRGLLATAQRQVRAAYLDPEGIRRRLRPVLRAVAGNLRDLHAAVESGDPAEFCRAMGFALWNICDALLVHCGRSPSRFHGLERLRPIEPGGHDAILRLESAVEMPPDVAAGHLEFLADRGVLGGGTLAKLRSMAARGCHREAFHIAFVSCLSGLVKEARRDADASKAERARAATGAWLSRLRWGDHVLAAKARQVERFAEQVCRLCDGGQPRAARGRTASRRGQGRPERDGGGQP